MVFPANELGDPASKQNGALAQPVIQSRPTRPSGDANRRKQSPRMPKASRDRTQLNESSANRATGGVAIGLRRTDRRQSMSFVLIIRSRMFFVIRCMRGSSRRKSLRGGF